MISNLKTLKQMQYKDISFEDIFGNVAYQNDLQAIADTAARRVGYNGIINVKLLCDTSMRDVAYTDGTTITINTGSSFADRLKKKPLLFHIFVVGLLAHELGHILWTDFEDGIKYTNALQKGEIYPEIPSHPNAVKYQVALSKECNRGLFVELAHALDNILEDIYVNALQTDTFNGLFSKGIALGNMMIAEDAQTIDEEKSAGTEDFIIVMNALLCNLKSERVFYGSYEAELKQRVDTITDIANQYIFKTAHTNRCIGVNLIICELWDLVEKMLSKAKESSQEQHSDSGNGHSGDTGTSNSESSSSDNSSENSTSHNTSSESKSSDNSSENTQSTEGDGSSSNNADEQEFDEEAVKEELKKILEQINGQTKEQNNSKNNKKLNNAPQSQGAKSSDENYDALKKALKETLENPPRLEQKTGQAVNAERQNIADKDFVASGEAEALSKLQKILDSIAEQKMLEQNETKVNQELQRIKPQDMPLIHKNCLFIINRPNKNAHYYKMIAKKVQKTTDALVKVVKRILKEENLNGERKGRYYGNLLDTNRLYRTDLKYFKDRKQPKKEIDLAVSLLIDESDSMCGERINKSTVTAVLFAEVCEQLQVPYEVFGHTASTGTIYLNNYKNFDSYDKEDKYRLASIKDYYCNRDGAAISCSVNRLKKRPEKKKLFILISDGQPNDYGYFGAEAKADLMNIKNKCLKDGIDFIAAAIGSDKEIIKQIYGKCFLNISDLASMPTTFGKILKNKMI